MKVVMVDYGVGNLRSVRKALETAGADVIQTDDPAVVMSGDKVVLPGVGAFMDGMAGLQKRGLITAIQQVAAQKTPLLGICLGMQLFLSSSSEMGDSTGLGLIPGTVEQFKLEDLKVPHTGWNQLQINVASPLFTGLEDHAFVYFNHGYYCRLADPGAAIASTDYGILFTSAFQFGSIYGVQFHPEKSQDAGLQILKNFVAVCQ